jgi:hypothetical protein
VFAKTTTSNAGQACIFYFFPMTFEEKVHALNQLIIQQQTIAALSQFYADNVVMQENETAPRIGLPACIQHEQAQLNSMLHFQATLLTQTIDAEKGIVFSEWQFYFTTRNNKTFCLTEVSLQYWENGKIYREKFYYNDAIEV